MSLKMVRDCCPGCGRKNTNNQKIFERDFSLAKEIVAFCHYNIYRCEECNLIYAGDIKEKAELDDYYDNMSKYENSSFCLSPTLEEYYKYEVEIFEPYLNKECDILDVGCAFGGLLNELKKCGYTNVWGLEPSKKNCDYAMKNYGITVFHGLLGDNTLDGKRFNMIILNSVLEHVMDIRGFIKECGNLLREDGILAITVPDVSMFKEHIDLFQQFSVEHINYFAIDTLDRLMEQEGFANKDYVQDHNFCMGSAGNMITIWQKEHCNGVEDSELFRKKCNTWKDSYEDIKVYMDECMELSDSINRRVDECELKDGYYIWGIGTITAMLIQMGIIKVELIRGVFDSNRNYHGLNAYGKVIEDPVQLKTKENYPIIIASQYAYNAIKSCIEKMNIDNRIIDLFGKRV